MSNGIAWVMGGEKHAVVQSMPMGAWRCREEHGETTAATHCERWNRGEYGKTGQRALQGLSLVVPRKGAPPLHG
jgi:hypothetical protein